MAAALHAANASSALKHATILVTVSAVVFRAAKGKIRRRERLREQGSAILRDNRFLCLVRQTVKAEVMSTAMEKGRARISRMARARRRVVTKAGDTRRARR